MLNMPGAKKADWWKLTKFAQFAYRRILIPGTRLPPYMVARGRQPSLSTELERLELGDALPTAPPLSEHMKELKKHMDLAVEILCRARDRTLAASREKFNANQTEVNFEPCERVRLWKRVVVRRHANASDLESSKLKLFNSEFEVVKRVWGLGNNYEIKDVITGKVTTAIVTQITRIRSVAPPAPEPLVVDASEKTWDRMKEGKSCVIWVKHEEKSVLRVLEVLEVEVQSEHMLGWHYIHKAFSSVYNAELPLVQRRLVPEWAHRRAQQRSPPKPPANQVHNYEKLYSEYNAGDIEINCAGLHLQSVGKLPEPVCKQTDAWRVASNGGSLVARAVLGLSYPNSDEVSKQTGFRKKR